MPWRIDTYHTPSGKAPLEAFITALDESDQAKLAALLSRLAAFGNALKLPHSRSLGGGLFELRTKSGVRVFYVFRPGQQVVLLDGIVKKRDDIPASVVARMRELADAIP